mmetsp:Transcript_71933/g.185539  ORF Transcript_71933/g.185539 Transcript_71933/m.185539 type:complete len:489 (+) Transcript_71933:805-2271(+)
MQLHIRVLDLRFLGLDVLLSRLQLHLEVVELVLHDRDLPRGGVEVQLREHVLVGELPLLDTLLQLLLRLRHLLAQPHELLPRLLALALQQDLHLPRLGVVRRHGGVVPVHDDELLRVALLLGLQKHLVPVQLLLFLEALPPKVADLEVFPPHLLTRLLPLRRHLLRLRDQVAALVALVSDDLLEHGHLADVRLELHLVLQVELLHRGLRVPDDALELHLRLGHLLQLLLDPRQGCPAGLQLHVDRLHLPHKLLLVLLQLLAELRLLGALAVEVLHVLAQVLGLDVEGPVVVRELPVLALQLLQLLLGALELIRLAREVNPVGPVLHAQVVERLLARPPLLDQIVELVVDAVELVAQHVALIRQLLPHMRLILALPLELPHLALLVRALLHKALVVLRLLLEMILELGDFLLHALLLLLQLAHLLLVALLRLSRLHDALLVRSGLRLEHLDLRPQRLELHALDLAGRHLFLQPRGQLLTLLALLLQVLL